MKILLTSLFVFQFIIAIQLPAQTPGELDLSFGTDGTVTSTFGPESLIYSLVPLNNGAFLAIGSGGNSLGFTIAKYNSDGTLDLNFGTEGIAQINLENISIAQSGLIQPNGKIVVAGFAQSSSQPNLVLARLLPTGELDTSFGEVGVVVSIFENHSIGFKCMFDPSTEKIYVSGWIFNTNPFEDDFIVARYHNNGTIDTEFGMNGRARIDFGGDDSCFGMDLRPNGKIVLSGRTESDASIEFAITQLNNDGTIDPSFGENGRFISAFENFTFNEGSGFVFTQNGSILMTGSIGTNDSNQDIAIIRVLENGTLDNSFGTEGFFKIDSGGDDNSGFNLSLDANEKIIVAGTTNVFGTEDFFLTRLWPDGMIDASFGNNGFQLIDFNNGPDQAVYSLIQSDGKILIGGSSDNNFALARFEGDQVIDEIEEISSFPGLHIEAFPNPFKEELLLTFSESREIRVKFYSSKGELIKNEWMEVYPNSPVSCSTDHLPAGVYAIQIIYDSNSKTIQAVKK